MRCDLFMPDSVRAVSESQTVAREQPWLTRVGIAGIVGGALAFVGFILLRTAIGGGANFESLADALDNSGKVWIAGVLTFVGYVLVAAPLYFLFRAAQARSERVKGQLVGLVVLGPVLLGVAALLISGGTQEAANAYLDGKGRQTLTPAEARKDCREAKADLSAKEFREEFPAAAGSAGLAACESKKAKEDEASNSIKDSTLLQAGQLAGLAGSLSLLVGLLYTGLWSMRTGLLTRFWGSLGMAVGFASIIGFSPLAFIWFIYVGVLLAGYLPGGRPPAWAAGEAIPWPTPGEKAAAELQREETVDPAEDEAHNGNGNGEVPAERRKRKRRD